MAGFQKATRKKVWLKVLLSGPSGSGKSYSALRLATGVARKCDSRIAYIGTEGSRDLYYSNEFDYDLIQLQEPFSIDKYVAAIDTAIKDGYKVLIVDSLSHEWKWLNETHDKMPGNSFQNWGKLKPQHNRFMEKVLFSPIHIIATARAKDEWVMEEKNGKQTPTKVGMGQQQDKDISYEYTVSLMIARDSHIASTDKDNTHIFDSKYDVLTEEHGEKLYEWANIGDAPAEVPVQTAQVSLEELKAQVVSAATEGLKTNKAAVMEVLKDAPGGNPNKIDSIEVAESILAKLQNIN